MTIKEFIDLFDNPCSLEKVLDSKGPLLQTDLVTSITLDNFFDVLKSQNKPFIDRNDLSRTISIYINTTGDSCSFIMTLFESILVKDGCSKEKIDEIMHLAYKEAREVREKEYKKAIEERRRLEKEQRQREEYLKKLEESLDMSKTSASYDVARFLIRNGTSYEELKESVNLALLNEDDINHVISEYRISSNQKRELISIENILGYDYSFHTRYNDLLKAFPSFFDSQKRDSYHTRSLSLLDLTTLDCMDKLSHSFDEEPLKVKEASEGKYTIGSNGLHRYSVLRTLYLIEMMRASGDKEQTEKIKEKYTIPVLVENIDYTKTYSNYILSIFIPSIWLKKELDEELKATGRSIINLPSGETLKLTDEELIVYVGNVIKEQKSISSISWLFRSTDPKLLEFLSLAVPELLESFKMEETNGKSK